MMSPAGTVICSARQRSGPSRTRSAFLGSSRMWNGARPAISELCADESIIEQLQRAGRLQLGNDRTLLGIHGLTLRSTVHRIERPDRSVVHTWCALDAIGIPAALQSNATAVTECPTCQTTLRVELAEG